MENLSPREAYIAMFIFLDAQYRMTKSDGLGAILGPMALLEDGSPVDSALWEDWIEAVEKARDNKNWGITDFRIIK